MRNPSVMGNRHLADLDFILIFVLTYDLFSAYTGYVDVNANHYFFYFFESRRDPDTGEFRPDGRRT